MANNSNAPDHQTIVYALHEALKKGENPALTVISQSMSPLIEVNDQVILSSIDFETLEKGDIITVTQRDALTTHRVVCKDLQTVVTKGDRNMTLDEPVPFDQVIGKVSQIHSKKLSSTIDLEASTNQNKLTLIKRLLELEHAARRNMLFGYRLIHLIVVGVIRIIKVTF